MIKAISMLGNPEPAVNVSNVNAPKAAEAPAALAPAEVKDAPLAQPAEDKFVPSADKKEEAPKADPNDKFEKAEDKKTEEAK